MGGAVVSRFGVHFFCNRIHFYMQKNQRLSNIYFLLALGLISLFAYILLFSAISFIRGYSISPWQFPAAAVMMLITQYYASHELFKTKPKPVFFRVSGILIALVLVCIVFANSFYDISYDGQWYHQETVYQLKTGWNPYHTELPVPKIPGIPDVKDVWCTGPHIAPKENQQADQPVTYIKYVSINYFSKGAEIAEASIYAMTNRIEAGKAINLMILLASLFMCLSALYTWNRWPGSKNWLIALLFTCNPVAIYQLTSFCVDGIVFSLLMSLLALFVLILLNNNKYTLFCFGLLILISTNIKFTLILYAAIFCLGFLCVLLLQRNRQLTKKFILAGAISFTVGFIFIGFHPFISNLISHDDMFYSMRETHSEIAGIMPPYLRNKNRFERFLITTGARSFDPGATETSASAMLKIPFTINKKELLNANNSELMNAGFGPFFSGALLISLLLGFITFKRVSGRIFRIAIVSTGFLLLSIFIVPVSWWARFVPQTWLVPCMILILSEFVLSKNRVIKILMYISLSINVLWAVSGIAINVFVSAHINYQIAQLKTVSRPIFVEYCGYRDFSSNRVRFYENNIPFVEKYVSGLHIYNVIHSNTRFETQDELPAVSPSFLMRMEEKWNPRVLDEAGN
jgi:hypothetical protein